MIWILFWLTLTILNMFTFSYGLRNHDTFGILLGGVMVVWCAIGTYYHITERFDKSGS